MTAAGALPPRKTVYDAPAIPPSEMTPEQQERYQVAQIAGIVAAAGLAKSEIADATTMALLPYLRAMNPLNAVEVAAFALKAAEIVEMGRQRAAMVTWSAVQNRLAVFDVPFSAQFREIDPSRTTMLDEAYKRPAGAYRKRMAGGVEGIKNLIDQAQEERFDALGGNKLKTGESDAKGKNAQGSQGKAGNSKQSKAKAGEGSVRKAYREAAEERENRVGLLPRLSLFGQQTPMLTTGSLTKTSGPKLLSTPKPILSRSSETKRS